VKYLALIVFFAIFYLVMVRVTPVHDVARVEAALKKLPVSDTAPKDYISE